MTEKIEEARALYQLTPEKGVLLRIEGKDFFISGAYTYPSLEEASVLFPGIEACNILPAKKLRGISFYEYGPISDQSISASKYSNSNGIEYKKVIPVPPLTNKEVGQIEFLYGTTIEEQYIFRFYRKKNTIVYSDAESKILTYKEYEVTLELNSEDSINSFALERKNSGYSLWGYLPEYLSEEKMMQRLTGEDNTRKFSLLTF